MLEHLCWRFHRFIGHRLFRLFLWLTHTTSMGRQQIFEPNKIVGAPMPDPTLKDPFGSSDISHHVGYASLGSHVIPRRADQPILWPAEGSLPLLMKASVPPNGRMPRRARVFPHVNSRAYAQELLHTALPTIKSRRPQRRRKRCRHRRHRRRSGGSLSSRPSSAAPRTC
jgi:hypothetical protein